jgi:tRNA(Ile)-lysidine synthase
MLLAHVKDTIRKYRLLKRGDRVVVAVSGGPDSVCLLNMLSALKEFELDLHIAHLDHMFRGKESEADARFVKGLAKKLGIPAAIEAIDVPAFCRERGLSAQAGAREVRYGFLARVAEQTGAGCIATGHTATDQAETFLMRMLRGAGVSGLSAIPPKRDNIIRPLIETTRDEVMDHLRANGIEFVTDSSNRKTVYTRNRIRMNVLPVLRHFNPRIVETLAHEAALLRDENEAIEAHLATLAKDLFMREDGVLSIQRPGLITLPIGFQRRMFRHAVDLIGEETPALSMVQIDEALAFMAAARTGRALRLPSGLRIEREYDRFILSASEGSGRFAYTLAVPGATAVSDLGIRVEIVLEGRPEQASEIKNYRWQALFDYDKMKPVLTLRSRKPGDRFHPAGMGGRSKKLQDYLVDMKVPRRRRDTVPLLCSGDDILWVVGYRTDERFIVNSRTKRVLIVRVENRSDA